jgi:hypothetical protein
MMERLLFSSLLFFLSLSPHATLLHFAAALCRSVPPLSSFEHGGKVFYG